MAAHDSISRLAQEHGLAFVLSTGRTGTMFLTQLIDRSYAGVRCVHEPRPSRALLVGGNVRNVLGRGSTPLQWLFETALRRRLEALAPSDRYIEINPLMTSAFDLIERLEGPIRILHMVRDPRTWAPSIRTFKASGYRRHLIDLVPLTKPLPVPRPAGWLRMPQLERSLWQWTFINDDIERRFSRRNAYARVRYEDVFSTDPGVQSDAVEKALRALGLDPAAALGNLDPQQRVNPAPSRPREDVDEDAVRRIGGELLSRYGYASD